MPYFGVPIRNGVPIGLGSIAGFGISPFDPSQLFAGGEQGGWYDPSDLTTLFQDAAGTTPVTAVEQPVGLVLDKSKGLVLGSELVTNGDFSNGTTGWSSSSVLTSTATVVDGEFRVTATATSGRQVQAITCEIGKTYVVTGRVRLISGTGSAFITLTPNDTGAGTYPSAANNTSTFIETRSQVVATATAMYVAAGSTGGEGVTAFDNISVRELPGNHLSQSTSTARPVLSARVNLLTQTENFASWGDVGGASATTISSNSIIAPDGTLTADTIAYNGGNYPARSNNADIPSNATMLCTARVQDINARYVYMSARGSSSNTYVFVEFDLQTNTVSRTSAAGTGWTYVASSGSVTATSNGFKLLSFRFTSGAVTAGVLFVGPCNGSANPNSSGYLDGFTPSSPVSFYIWGADLRPSNAGVGLPAYQRVGASTDYDTTGFPLYLKFDGTDDFLVSGTITPGSVDKAQVFAGVRKLSDAVQIISEYSGDVDGNNGALNLYNFTDAKFYFENKGTVKVFTGSNASTAPITAVLSGLGDIGGDSVIIRQNGSQASVNTSDQGTGNYGSYPLYLGARGGTLYRFNGQLYSLILRFSATNMDAATIASTETWVNSKTGAY